MAYNIVYKKSVHRDLKKLSKTEAKRILDLIEKELIRQPESNPVLKGRFAGRHLSELSLDEGIALHREVSEQDRDSVALVETWLERTFGDSWRGSPGGQERAGRSDQNARGKAHSATLSREEALELLGLQAGATEAEIREAHRRLMQKCHPDHGGSTYLAARINAAKEILLS